MRSRSTTTCARRVRPRRRFSTTRISSTRPPPPGRSSRNPSCSRRRSPSRPPCRGGSATSSAASRAAPCGPLPSSSSLSRSAPRYSRSGSAHADRGRRAAVAMLAFGFYYVPMHAASQGDFLWAAFIFRLTSLTVIAAAWLALRPRRADRADLPALAAIGALDTGGNVFFAAASESGLVSVVSILASLYPVVTVLLARAVLHERVHRSQELGICLALGGIALISAG